MTTDPYAGLALLAGYPVDHQALTRAEQLIPPDQRFVVTEAHVQVACGRCCQPTWVGPRQYEAVQAGFPPTIVLCLPCIVAHAQDQDADICLG